MSSPTEISSKSCARLCSGLGYKFLQSLSGLRGGNRSADRLRAHLKLEFQNEDFLLEVGICSNVFDCFLQGGRIFWC